MTKRKNAPGAGRPKNKTPRINLGITLPQATIDLLDDLIASHPNFKDRSRAIEALVNLFLPLSDEDTQLLYSQPVTVTAEKPQGEPVTFYGPKGEQFAAKKGNKHA